MHDNHQKILDALHRDPSALIEWAATALIALGAKSEWDMEDNFYTTESLASLADDYGLPSAGNQDKEALRFYGEAAQELGCQADIDDWDEGDEDGAPATQAEVTTPDAVYATDDEPGDLLGGAKR